MTSITYQGVGKSFGAVAVIRSLDIAVPSQAFVALLGPSGCGKTTALRMLAGLELPTAGRILIGDRDVSQLAPRDRDIAMVFQSYALYPHMTVGENISYPLRIRKFSKAECDLKIAEVSSALEVGHLLDRYPRQLSGGQRQRIALARAIVRNPAAFLMDEPLSNLDARLRLVMRGEIKRLCQRLGTTTLYVTHDQAEALTMADFIAVMSGGDLQQFASPADIYDRPANRFVATFVGNPPMNILACSVDETGLHIGEATLPLDAARAAACQAAGVTEIGIRPEDIGFAEPGMAGALPGEVYTVEPMGNETLVDVLIRGEHVAARTGRNFAAGVGETVGIVFNTDDACFFNSEGRTVVHRIQPGGED